MARFHKTPDSEDHIPDEEEDGIAEMLGDMPRASLSAMVDYGLSDSEIGKYYGLSSATIRRLRTAWRIVTRL
ncbi:hypothetical protein [Roseovarius sp. E0-M6]|uniref:hypothetical protein n=1 Tax=Roseovarius sp. E0-M6 TaxID=3127118 RepID=UPI00300FCEF0